MFKMTEKFTVHQSPYGRFRTCVLENEVWIVGRDLAKAIGQDRFMPYKVQGTPFAKKILYKKTRAWKEIWVLNIKGVQMYCNMDVKRHARKARQVEEWLLDNVFAQTAEEATQKREQAGPLVSVQDNQAVADSRVVAERFEKQHKNVIQTIEKLKAENPALRNLFYETEYKVPGNNKSYKMYLMNKKGFALIVMGFTGSKAMEWKIKFFDAFEAMEKALKEKPQLPAAGQRTHEKPAGLAAMQEIGSMSKVMGEILPAASKENIALAAVKMVSKNYKCDLQPFVDLISTIPVKGSRGIFTVSQLADEVGLYHETRKPNARAINKTLEKMGLQEKDKAGNWQLTDAGNEYAECFSFERNGHQG